MFQLESRKTLLFPVEIESDEAANFGLPPAPISEVKPTKGKKGGLPKGQAHNSTAVSQTLPRLKVDQNGQLDIQPGDYVKDKRHGRHWKVLAVEWGAWSGKMIIDCECDTILYRSRTILYFDEVAAVMHRIRQNPGVSGRTGKPIMSDGKARRNPARLKK